VNGITGFARDSEFEGADADGDGDGDGAADGAVYIALDATTRVAMYGERYVHGLVSQSFGDAPSPFDLHLVMPPCDLRATPCDCDWRCFALRCVLCYVSI